MLFLVCCLLAQSAKSYYELGLEAYSRDDLSAAEAYLKQARQADSRLFPARFLLGATLVRMNHRDEALRELEAALKSNRFGYCRVSPPLRAMKSFISCSSREIRTQAASMKRNSLCGRRFGDIRNLRA